MPNNDRKNHSCHASESWHPERRRSGLDASLRWHDKNNAGFTLLEILIALFIFTLVAAIMTHALRTVFNAQARTEEHATRLAKLQMATLLLSRDIEQIINRPIINREEAEDPAVIGNAHEIMFTHGGFANPLGQLQRSTLQRTHYFLANHTLIRETWQVLDQSATSKSDQRRLLSDVTQLRFEYVDQDNRVNDKWPPPNQKNAELPKAVRVIITINHWGQLTQFYLIPGQPLETKVL
jgi:general secretion pathway protein J